MKWILRGKRGNAEKMAADLGLSEITAQVLLNRGIYSAKGVRDFFDPRLEAFGDISSLPEVEKGFEIIKESIRKGEKITVYGDYDADGVMSSTILIKGLRGLGAETECYIPHRLYEGYGLNMGAVKKIADGGTGLIICCDNGIAAIEECGYIKALGMKLVVLDHHSPYTDKNGSEILPKADALIDLKLKDCPYPFKELCAGGLCYRFINGLYSSIGRKIDKEAELFIFASIATICDMVELQGENRVFAHLGLRLMNSRKNTNLGLREVISALSLSRKEIDDRSVGFGIGPFINSAGRMGKAADYIDIFLSDDRERVTELVEELKGLNEQRKLLTDEAYLKAAERLKDNNEDKVIVEYLPDIHESLAGLAAGKLKERFSRPVIVLSKGESCVKGSGRSVEGYNMFSAVNGCRDLLLRFGGHSQAVGLSLDEENISELKRRLNEGCSLSLEDMERKIYIDRETDFNEISLELSRELKALKPFGVGNPSPVFAAKGVFVKRLRFVGKQRRVVQFVFYHNETELKGVGFGIFDKLKDFIISRYSENVWDELYNGQGVVQFFADILFGIEENFFNGRSSVQLVLEDFRAFEEG
ncbi:MAG: single-stranded-DNA-specific exonuclease RecJ [Eubacterium sp.]|nr:single-stranded-DNA-specific exonuclease RecJ [Eubacterium sp.]